MLAPLVSPVDGRDNDDIRLSLLSWCVESVRTRLSLLLLLTLERALTLQVDVDTEARRTERKQRGGCGGDGVG